MRHAIVRRIHRHPRSGSIPLNAVPPVERGMTAYRMGPSSGRPRLLVVDDQPLNIQALYQAFSADHQVLMAMGGEQALAICANQHPDLILLDVSMPGMDGFEICGRLKADPSTRDIPVIFVTAHSDVASETRGLELGAADFIFKPISPKIVRARVKTHLTLKAQSDLLRQWAYLDGLTGVYNRRYFDERLAVEWDVATRTGTALSIILLGVDFFKRYNDRYGHQAGDDCLREIAPQLKDGLRQPTDLVAATAAKNSFAYCRGLTSAKRSRSHSASQRKYPGAKSSMLTRRSQR